MLTKSKPQFDAANNPLLIAAGKLDLATGSTFTTLNMQQSGVDGVTIANDVVLNQVLVRFGDDEQTDRVVDAVQRQGECWMGATTWHGRRLMRISVSNWRTTEADVARAIAAAEAALAV